MDWYSQYKHKRGRPKQTWRCSNLDKTKKIGQKWSEIKREAKDHTFFSNGLNAIDLDWS